MIKYKYVIYRNTYMLTYDEFIKESSISSYDNFDTYFKKVIKHNDKWIFKSSIDLPDIEIIIDGDKLKFLGNDSLRCENEVQPFDIIKSELDNNIITKDLKIKTNDNTDIVITLKDKSKIDKVIFELVKTISGHMGANGQ